MDKKETTIDDLAVMINRGFTETQKYLDQHLGSVKQELTATKQIQKDILEELTATHADVNYVRNTLSHLVRNDIAQDEAIEDLDTRVGHLEQKPKFA